MRVWLLCVNNRVCSCLNHHKLFILSQWRRGIKTATHIHRHTYTKTHTRTDEEAKSLHLTLSPKPPPLPAHSTSASISFLPSQDVKVKASPAGCKQLSGLSWDTAVTRLRLSLNPSTKRHAENTFLKRLVLVPALQWGLSLRGTLCFYALKHWISHSSPKLCFVLFRCSDLWLLSRRADPREAIDRAFNIGRT